MIVYLWNDVFFWRDFFIYIVGRLNVGFCVGWFVNLIGLLFGFIMSRWLIISLLCFIFIFFMCNIYFCGGNCILFKMWIDGMINLRLLVSWCWRDLIWLVIWWFLVLLIRGNSLYFSLMCSVFMVSMWLMGFLVGFCFVIVCFVFLVFLIFFCWVVVVKCYVV